MNESDIIRRYIKTDVYSLAAKEKWFEKYDKQWLIQQIQSRQKAELKLPSWYGNFNLLFPPPISVEQSSSELTADYKASLLKGDTLIDMTGGMGVDCAAFARRFRHVSFIEQQENLASLARHNFRELSIQNIDVISGNSVDILPDFPPVDVIFIDPARRKDSRKVFLLEDCQPNLLTLFPLLENHCRQLMVKLSPMFDISLLINTLHKITDIHVVAVHNEIKELLAIFDFQNSQPLKIHCVNISKNNVQKETFDYTQRDATAALTEKVEAYLYEPHPTLLKSGMMNAAAASLGLLKLHVNSHLYTSEKLFPQFFGRIFQVEDVFTLNKQSVRDNLHDLTSANITIRNFPMAETELRKRLKLADGGETTLFATTLNNNKHVLIKTKKVQEPIPDSYSM